MTIRDHINEQPAVIDRVFRDFPRLLDGLEVQPPDAVWLVGSGTSKNALLAVQPLFERLLNVPVHVEGPIAFMRRAPAGSGRLAIVLSQTGGSTTSVAAVERAQAFGFQTLALTADGASPFGRAARMPLVLPIGPEPVGPKTKGYTASLAGLIVLAHVLAGQPVPVGPDEASVAAIVRASETAARPLALAGLDQVMILAQGRHMGSALEGALKVAEISGIAASAFDTEEALHGRFHALTPSSLALFIVADAMDREMAEVAAVGLEGLGIAARILDLAGQPRSHGLDLGAMPVTDLADCDVLWATLPFQWLAVLLAEARGMRPEDMRYPDMSQRLGIKTGRVP